MRLRAGVLAALGAAALLAACGAPDELDSDDDQRLSAARAELDDALDTEETIRTSPEMARTLVRLVERADEGRLRQRAPSLISPEGGLDEDVAVEFTRYAASNAPRALLIPATRAVEEIDEVVDDSGADEGTKVPHARDAPLDRYLDQVERDIRDVWPALSKQVEELP